jgi:uncharacterized protein
MFDLPLTLSLSRKGRGDAFATGTPRSLSPPWERAGVRGLARSKLAHCGIRHALAIAFLVMPLAFEGRAFAQSAGVPAAKTPFIEVSGRGSVQAEPDMATIRIGVTTENAKVQDAVSANTAATEKVLSELQQASIDKKDLKTSNFSVYPQYKTEGENKHQVITYRVSNTVTVTIRDISKVGDILAKAVVAGSNQITGPSFSVSKPEKYMNEARKKAVENALEKARTYAGAAGLQLGPILEISEPGLPTPVNFTMARSAAAAPVPIEAGEEKLEAQIFLVVELKQ